MSAPTATHSAGAAGHDGDRLLNLTLRIWRQKDAKDPGGFQTYQARNISIHMSFLEMLDVVNEDLVNRGEEPIAFDSDCREGICGMCGFIINGIAHGPNKATTVCQLHMRFFEDGQTITMEPFRARSFPVLKDLCVDRSAFDRIIQSGGFISVGTGAPVDANAIPVSKEASDRAFDAATCIACGACVAACPNASAMLFTSAKVSHLNLLPQGQPERYSRTRHMVIQMEEEGFGSCSNHGECEAVCPKGIGLDFISVLNRDLVTAAFKA